MYLMKQAAEKMEISVHTLRFYTNEGLFPNVTRNKQGNRMFSDDDLEWVYMAQCLRDTGMPIEDIKHYFALCTMGDSTVSERYQMVLIQKERAEAELISKQRQFDMLEWKIGYYESVLNGEDYDRYNPAQQFIAEKNAI